MVALGQEIKADCAVPFAEQSSDGGASWRQVPYRAADAGVRGHTQVMAAMALRD